MRSIVMSASDLSFVDVDGYSIGYRQAGEGAPIVLLHGFLCDSRCWRRQIRELSDHFRVVAWDAPGAGTSSDPPENFTTAAYARCLAGLLGALGILRAHVVGLSWGGILAQEFYRLYPECLSSLVLADTVRRLEGLSSGG
jgi:pimeloyl-ACP methyl ester carboxylesterase